MSRKALFKGSQVVQTRRESDDFRVHASQKLVMGDSPAVDFPGNRNDVLFLDFRVSGADQGNIFRSSAFLILHAEGLTWF